MKPSQFTALVYPFGDGTSKTVECYLASDYAALEARCRELEDALRWIKGECLFAFGRSDGFDLRKNLGEISHRVSLAINGSEPETGVGK